MCKHLSGTYDVHMVVENPGQRTQSPGKDPACTGELRATQKSVNSIGKNGERSRALEPGRLPGSAPGVLDPFPNFIPSHSLEVENGNDTHSWERAWEGVCVKL